ncbi:hypothetical protein H2200_012855 [Cladophialophora chaetospira]|uniref:Uncharacterized protein n=1 Tax=Cladophialophora chaetospira TaxID=386627 RepID=A0AA39CBZ8_9EURO|nr:hypothetical protein H2200_012855 [Cladophialophora chaetospira]
MNNIVKEGEQMLENREGGVMNEQASAQGDFQDNQRSQQSQQGQQPQQGGGMMRNIEQNAGDAYVNQEVNGFLNKGSVPSGLDGAIDGAVDTEVNNLEKDF